MQRVVLRHLSGSKANQVEEFPLDYFKELTFGREPSCSVKYDPDRDDLVGRQHAKIVQDPSDPTQFIIADLNSRNGTFVNKQRLVGSIGVGDVIQFGAGGPEFQFDLEPRPQQVTRDISEASSPRGVPPTRTGGSGNIPPTRAGDIATTIPAMIGPSSAGPSVVGKATVERMISQTKIESRKHLLVGGGIIGLVVAAVAAVLIYQNIESGRRHDEELANAAVNPTYIAKNNTGSVVFIEAGWDLVHIPSGDKVYHEYIANFNPLSKGPLIPNGKQYLPVYIQFSSDGKIEPSLTTDPKGGNQPVGGPLTGTGFVVGSEGFILTNRHVAAAWNTKYDLSDALPGIVVKIDDQGNTRSLDTGADKKGKSSRATEEMLAGRLDQFPDGYRWVPAESRSFGRKPVRGKLLEGRNVLLDVTFAKTELNYHAKLVNDSHRHDVAMIKIDTPQSVPPVQLYDNYDQLQPGDTITILGYPAVSPDVVVGPKSHDPFNRMRQYKAVPDPSVTGGLVGKVIRDAQSASRREEYEFFSEFGDSIQLTASSTGAGNSGGPVFDDRGRVIAIFYAGARLAGDASITFAVPIRYGMELMRTSPVLK